MKAFLWLIVIVAAYVLFVRASARAAADLCDSHPVGSPLDDFENFEGPWLLSRMGPGPDPDRPGARFAIYCASLTMCDNSCRLSVADGSVVDARSDAL